MKLKQTCHYLFRDCRGALIVFYFVIFCVCVLTLLGAGGFSLLVGGEVYANFAGMELASLIFLFVVGLCSFGENFAMLSQNGVTRRTFFAGSLLVQATIALGMALVDRGICMLLKFIISHSAAYIAPPLEGAARMEVWSLFDLFFRSEYFYTDPPAPGLGTLIPAIGLYFLALAIGFFIVIMYNRLSKGGIIAVSVGVPVTLVIVLPLLDAAILGGVLQNGASRVLVWAFRLAADAPVLSLGCTMLIVAMIYALSWLMLRRLPMKK